MSNIQKHLARLIKAHGSNDLRLRQPLSESDEDNLAMVLEPCDEDLIDLLSLHDGQEQLARTTLFPGYNRLLGSKEIAERYLGTFKYGEKDGLPGFLKRAPLPEYHDPRVLEDRIWQTGWLAFAGEIEWIFIDHNPSDFGTSGQIVAWNRDDCFGNVIARDLSHYLELSCEMLEQAIDKPHFSRLVE